MKRKFPFVNLFVFLQLWSSFISGTGSNLSNLSRQTGGPHVCRTNLHEDCCPGWKRHPSSGLCITPICHACGSGACIYPNLCLCNDGSLSARCHSYSCQDLACQQLCVDTNTGPHCSCLLGFHLQHDNSTCEDINECSVKNGRCHHFCQNIPGSFRCFCKYDYKLQANGVLCIKQASAIHGNAGMVGPSTFANRNKFRSWNFSHSVPMIRSEHIYKNSIVPYDGRKFHQQEKKMPGNLAGDWETKVKSFMCPHGNCSNFEYDANRNFEDDGFMCQKCHQACHTSVDYGARCGCWHGFSLSGNGVNCVDVDECYINPSVCINGRCINTIGSFICHCRRGYQLLGNVCMDINECLPNSRLLCDQVCINVPGSFQCSCVHGYIMSSEGKACIDVNECELNVCSHMCVNVPGKYLCKCPYGMELNSDGQTCRQHIVPHVSDESASKYSDFPYMEDEHVRLVNSRQADIHSEQKFSSWGEKQLSSHAWTNMLSSLQDKRNPGRQKDRFCAADCLNGGICENTNCKCPPGFKGFSCEEDVNECEVLPEDVRCSYKCVNTYGSFLCVCPPKHTLNADKKSCKPVGCRPNCMNGGTCVNGDCRCLPGFSGAICTADVNECEKPEVCHHVCRNTFGSFACFCHGHSTLADDGYSCIEHRCIPSCKNNGSCRRGRCHCKPGFTGRFCQLDINECAKNITSCSHTCINLFGSYQCLCPADYELASNRQTCYAQQMFITALPEDNISPEKIESRDRIVFKVLLNNVTSAEESHLMSSPIITADAQNELRLNYKQSDVKILQPSVILSGTSSIVNINRGSSEIETVLPIEIDSSLKDIRHSLSLGISESNFITNEYLLRPYRTLLFENSFSIGNFSLLDITSSLTEITPDSEMEEVLNSTQLLETVLPTDDLMDSFTYGSFSSPDMEPTSDLLFDLTKFEFISSVLENFVSNELDSNPIFQLNVESTGSILSCTNCDAIPEPTANSIDLEATQTLIILLETSILEETSSVNLYTEVIQSSLIPNISNININPSINMDNITDVIFASSVSGVPNQQAGISLLKDNQHKLKNKGKQKFKKKKKEKTRKKNIKLTKDFEILNQLLHVPEKKTGRSTEEQAFNNMYDQYPEFDQEEDIYFEYVDPFDLSSQLETDPMATPPALPSQLNGNTSELDCFFEGKEFKSRSAFYRDDKNCTKCVCVDGELRCGPRHCPPVHCESPLSGDCCDYCPGDCVYEKHVYLPGDTFSPELDPCRECYCENGRSVCSDIRCPALDCPLEFRVFIPEECCPACLPPEPGCFSRGRFFYQGQLWVKKEGGCHTCLCKENGDIQCNPVVCVVNCQHPVFVPGECCPLCEGCQHYNQKYEDGEIFSHPADKCRSCQCQHGNISCFYKPCETNCSHPYQSFGECCPECKDCLLDNMKITNGTSLVVGNGSCQECFCQNGNVQCKPTPCASQCVVGDKIYQSGATFHLASDACTSCRCSNGSVSCEAVSCPHQCSFGILLQDSCCLDCSKCDYQGKVYSDMEVFRSSVHQPCVTCLCVQGNIKCEDTCDHSGEE